VAFGIKTPEKAEDAGPEPGALEDDMSRDSGGWISAYTASTVGCIRKNHSNDGSLMAVTVTTAVAGQGLDE
jgi:hypothetical protein